MRTLKAVFQYIREVLLLNYPTDPEIHRVNIHRIVLFFYIVFPLHIIHVLIFYRALVNEAALINNLEYGWRMGIIYAHGLMAFLISLIALAAYLIKKSELENSTIGRMVPQVGALSYLIFGALVCTIDQSVTESISPYLNASMAIALVFILRPSTSVVLYSISYLFFFFILPFNQPDKSLLLSVYVNGLTVAALAFGLSIILWRGNSLNFLQKRKIEDQHLKLERQTIELEKKNKKLEQLAQTDMLTGLYNRMSFTETVKHEIARVRRTGDESCLILLDLDNFKEANDLYGHPLGDLVLKRIAQVVKNQLRETDILARFGGDEFAILLPSTPLEGAILVAEKVRQAIADLVIALKNDLFQITASFGLVSLSTADMTFEKAYHEADTMLYRGKKSGGNRVEYTGKSGLL